MKYGIDIGHNCPPDVGGKGFRSEDELSLEVGIKVIERLKASGETVIECLPKGAKNVGDSLYLRVNTANENNVDLFLSIHFNSGGGRGTEVYVVNTESRIIAQKILKNIVELGYLNRGIKREPLYVLRNCKSLAIVVQCCFIDSKEDMMRFDSNAMAEAIVKGLLEREKRESMI